MTIDQIRAELQAWQNALRAHDAGDFRTSLRLFEPIAETSKIIVNVALIHDRLGERTEAIENLTKAIELDKYLAIGYLQRGVSYFHAGQYDAAVNDFSDAQQMMRTNVEINYDILGLNYKLKLSEILFNKWLSLLKLGRTNESAQVLQAIREASPPPSSELRAMIDSAMTNLEDAIPCALPAGTLYRPSATKMQLLNSASQTTATSTSSTTKPRKTKPQVPSLRTATSETASVISRKRRKHKSSQSVSSSYVGSPLSGEPKTRLVADRVPRREELTRVIGSDLMQLQPLTEIGSTPCAGVRISHGPLAGLMAWRLVVRPEGSKSSRSSSPAAVVVNFILDTGSQDNYVPADALAALGYSLSPGAEVTLRVQGIKTRCIVVRPDEAGRIGVSFMTAGSLTYYFDAGLVAPVLYDGSTERPSNVPRTIRAEELPKLRRSWLIRLFSVLSFSRRHT